MTGESPKAVEDVPLSGLTRCQPVVAYDSSLIMASPLYPQVCPGNPVLLQCIPDHAQDALHEDAARKGLPVQPGLNIIPTNIEDEA